MSLEERRPTLLSAMNVLSRRVQSVATAQRRSATKTFTGLSVSGVTPTTSKDVFSQDLKFALLETGLIEVWAGFTGTISGAGRTMTMSLVVDGLTYQIMQFANVTSENRWTDPSNNTGTTTTRGGFMVRLDEIAAGSHSLNFRFTASGAGANGSATSGMLAYRIS